jgi:hypothetical protein
MLSQLSGWMADANPQPQPFEPSTLPGIWRQTASGPAQFSRIGLVTPFALPTPTYFLPAPFPQLESSEYAANINEIQSLGSVNSTTRTPRQTMLAQLVDAPTVVHSEPCDRFWAFAVDAANSRLWGGIHYTFELTTSQHSCVQVADFVVDHRMRKLPTS